MAKQKTFVMLRLLSHFRGFLSFIAVFALPVMVFSEGALGLPCSVKLQFEEDDGGAQVVYTLSLQVKNPAMRPVETVSVLMFDDEGKSLGNTDANCRYHDTLLNGGDTGECKKVLQVVNSKLMEKLGNEIWTAIVNDQMTKFDQITECEILGFRYVE